MTTTCRVATPKPARHDVRTVTPRSDAGRSGSGLLGSPGCDGDGIAPSASTHGPGGSRPVVLRLTRYTLASADGLHRPLTVPDTVGDTDHDAAVPGRPSDLVGAAQRGPARYRPTKWKSDP